MLYLDLDRWVVFKKLSDEMRLSAFFRSAGW